MNDLGTMLRAQDAMNTLELWMESMTPGCYLRAINDIDSLGLWLI